MRIASTLSTLLLALPTTAGAVPLSFDRGIDTTLYDAPVMLSNALGSGLFAGSRGNGDTLRSLLQFDLGTSIPAGSIVHSVNLTLRVDTPRSRGGTVQLHRVTTAWGEGTSNANVLPGSGGGDGAPATPGDATWSHARYDASLWASPGGDFEAAVSGAQAIARTRPDASFGGPGLVADVQAWIDGRAPNYGWLIKREIESRRAIRFASFQSPAVGTRPRLEIDFTPVPEPGSAVLLALGLAGMAVSRPGHGGRRASGMLAPPRRSP